MSALAGWLAAVGPQAAHASGGTACAAVSHIEATTHWEAQTVSTGVTVGEADITVTVPSAGQLLFGGPGIDNPTPAPVQPGDAHVGPPIGIVPAGQTENYQLTYSPSGSSSTTCPPVTIAITWLSEGQGATATADGTVIPGSNTYHPVNNKPTITGIPNVAKSLTCSSDVTTTEFGFGYLWSVNGTILVNQTNVLKQVVTVPNDWFGKTVNCATIDTAGDGWAAVWSDHPVTVGPGTLTMVSRPHVVASSAYVGVPAQLATGNWSPSSAAVKFAYRWYLASKAVAGATHSRFAIPKSASGKSIYCRLTVTAAGYKTVHVSTPTVRIKG